MATNFEFYKDQILEIAKRGSLAVCNDKPVSCGEIQCTGCLFKRDEYGCAQGSELFNWLYAEHIEQPKLTKRERAFCEAVQTGCIAGMFACSVWSESEPEKVEKHDCLIFGEGVATLKIPSGLNLFCWIKKNECYSVEYLLKLDVMEEEVQHETD